jgi:hypothetical protein
MARRPMRGDENPLSRQRIRLPAVADWALVSRRPVFNEMYRDYNGSLFLKWLPPAEGSSARRHASPSARKAR